MEGDPLDWKEEARQRAARAQQSSSTRNDPQKREYSSDARGGSREKRPDARFFAGTIVSPPQMLLQSEIPNALVRWTRSAFLGRSFACRREGIAMTVAAESDARDVRRVAAYGRATESTLWRPGQRVRLRVRKDSSGIYVADRVQVDDGKGGYRNAMRGVANAWSVRLGTVLAGVCAWSLAMAVIDGVRNVQESFALTAENATVSANEFFQRFAAMGEFGLEYVGTILLMVVGIFMMLGSGRR